jgi:hypothetical protein
MEDRKRFIALPYVPQGVDKTPTFSSSYISSPSSAVLKPKPILVDKQSSEPSSPTFKNFSEISPAPVIRRPMHRGFSDLGNRIKKRVTLRFVFNSSTTKIFRVTRSLQFVIELHLPAG